MSITPVSTSEAEFRAILTSPFLLKKVTINAHTPYDAPKQVEADEVYSRSDLPSAEAVSTHRLRLRNYNVGVLDLSKSSAEVVKEMISEGYSAENAIDFQKAIEFDPSYYMAYYQLGKAYEKIRDERSALVAYEQFLSIEPDEKDLIQEIQQKVISLGAKYY